MTRGQREVVPRHDPIPARDTPLRARFWRVFRLLGVFALAIGALSTAIVARSVAGLHIHMLIATAIGTTLIVLVGGALMTLVFLSASSGHDSAAAAPPHQEND